MRESEIKARIEIITGRKVVDLIAYALGYFVKYTYYDEHGKLLTDTYYIK